MSKAQDTQCSTALTLSLTPSGYKSPCPADKDHDPQRGLPTTGLLHLLSTASTVVVDPQVVKCIFRLSHQQLNPHPSLHCRLLSPKDRVWHTLAHNSQRGASCNYQATIILPASMPCIYIYAGVSMAWSRFGQSTNANMGHAQKRRLRSY
jgi:hypothetical protein